MASIICGNCKQTHFTVGEVKDCYAGKFGLPKVASRIGSAAHATIERAVKSTEFSNLNEHGQTKVGFYKTANGIYKVTPARASDRTFAHQLLSLPQQTPEWTYMGLAKKFIDPDAAPLSREDAAEFGHTHGCCIACGRLLTDPVSVEAGIGPICAAKNGWA